jgi:hypothetical protein
MRGMNNFSDIAALESHVHDTIEVLVAPSTLDLFASNMWRQCVLKAVREDAPPAGDQFSAINPCFRCGQSGYLKREAGWLTITEFSDTFLASCNTCDFKKQYCEYCYCAAALSHTNRFKSDHQIKFDPRVLPTEWDAQLANNGKVYFLNHSTKKTQWVRPTDGLASVTAAPIEQNNGKKKRFSKLRNVNPGVFVGVVKGSADQKSYNEKESDGGWPAVENFGPTIWFIGI